MIPGRTRRAVAWIVLLVLIALLVVAARRIDLVRVAAALRVVRLPWVLGALVGYLLLLPMWATQWHLLAPPVARNTWRRMLGLVAMASSTHATTAFFMGEATSAVLLRTQAGLAASEVVSVIGMDQLLVGLAKLAVLLTAATALALPDWLGAGIATLGVGVGALLVATLFGAFHYDAVATRAARVMPLHWASALEGIARALQPLRTPGRGGVALLLALAKMAAEVTAIVCIQRAFGIELPIATAVLVLATIQMATLVPVVPANLGVYEGAIVLIYSRLGIPTEIAVSMAVVQHAVSFAALALPGYGWFGGAVGAERATATS